MDLDNHFAPLLSSFNLHALDRISNTVYAIDADARLRYCNAYWHSFAHGNGGATVPAHWPLGCCVLDAISGVQRQFFEEFFAGAMQARQTSSFVYECSGPEQQRHFCMILYPLAAGAGLLIDHAPVRRPGILRPSFEFSRQRYVDEEGIIRQCGHCRRIRHLGFSERWDWVPEMLTQAPQPNAGETPLQVVHGLCNLCLDYYYPASG